MNYQEAQYCYPEKNYHTGDHLVYSCQYHVVFCPKYRRKILKPPYNEILKNLFLETAEKFQFTICEMEVMPDHVQLLIDCNPRFGICRCVKELKGYSSHVLRGEYPEIKRKLPTLWTRGAFISSVGSVSLEVVKQYIEDQKGV